MTRRFGIRSLVGGAVLAFTTALAGTVPAMAQEKPANYPNRPIEIVVFYSAGGGLDVSARIFAQRAEEVLGHQFRVVNRTGAGGLVGHTYFAKEAPADGYTLAITVMGNLFNFVLDESNGLSLDDFDPLGFIAFEPYLVVSTGASIPEIEAKAKAEGAENIRLGIVPGSLGDLIGPVLEKKVGGTFSRVPYQGGAPRLLGLLNGTIDLAPAFYSEARQHYEAGNVKFIGVSDTQPHSVVPDVPTLPSLGYDVPPGTFGATRFVVAPDGIPADIRAYLDASIKKVLEDPATVEAYAKTGVNVTYLNAADTGKMYDDAFGTIRDIIQSSN